MPLVSGSLSEERLRSFDSCLVDGDLHQRSVERRVRRGALCFSVVLQSAVAAALILLPLLGKPPQITAREVVPIPPYYHAPGPRRSSIQRRMHVLHAHCYLCASARIPPAIPVFRPDTGPNDLSPDQGIDLGPGPTGNQIPDGINMFDNRNASSIVQPPARTRRVRIGTIEPAMLIHRVEPIYPTLMRQVHKSGRVELHAIISTVGTIESLQVISGDAGFYQSALEAVRQWRYRPTILNGQSVEVETTITVIYNAQ
jgi:protein TonB